MEAEKDLKPASYVYVARAWSTGCEYQIKVGRSIDPDKRIERLKKDIDHRTKNPHKFPEGIIDIELIAMWAGGKETERLLRQLLNAEFVHPENKKWNCGEYLYLSKPYQFHKNCEKDYDDPYKECELNNLLHDCEKDYDDTYKECELNKLLHDELIDYLLCLGFETPEMLKILAVVWHRENNYSIPINLQETAEWIDKMPTNAFELISKGN
jgi:hypothetical protein